MPWNLMPVDESLKAAFGKRVTDELIRRGANVADFEWLVMRGRHFAKTFIQEICNDILIETTLRIKWKYRVKVHYAEDVAALAKKCGIHMNFLDNVPFKTRKRGTKIITVVLKPAYEKTSTERILRAHKTLKLRPATIHELLALVRQYPILAQRLSLVALGSPFKENQFRPNHIGYPCIFTDKEGPEASRLRRLSNNADYPGHTWDRSQILV